LWLAEAADVQKNGFNPVENPKKWIALLHPLHIPNPDPGAGSFPGQKDSVGPTELKKATTFWEKTFIVLSSKARPDEHAQRSSWCEIVLC